MDNVTKAKINLYAVLRNMQELCEMDDEAKELIKNEKLSVQFVVPDVGEATLIFKDGHCKFIPHKAPAALTLWFTSPEHFNKMIAGEKTIPIFLNVFKVGFLLKVFQKLADRLSYYLKPVDKPLDELLQDENYFRINTYLTAYTAFFALCEIGNSDEKGRASASRIPEGEIQLSVKDGPSMVVSIDGNHVMGARIGTTDNPRAMMVFGSMRTANDILNGKSDIFSNLGSGNFMIKGYLPMLDNLNKLLSQVGFYLK